MQYERLAGSKAVCLGVMKKEFERMKIHSLILLATMLLMASSALVAEPLFDNSDFEKGDLTNWTPKGDAFTVQPTKGDNPKLRKKGPTEFQGKFWIGTFEKYDGKTGKAGLVRGDKPTGTLTSIPFTLKKRYITFRIGGGSNAAEVGVKLLHEGKEKVLAAGANAEPMSQVSCDAGDYLGKEIQLVVYDNAKGHWGHINVDDFAAGDKPVGRAPKASLPPGAMDPAHRTFASYMDVGYDQKYRPQFHFTSRKNWLNDPNGMVYYDGEYHLYFQHHALGLGPGAKSWGHAVSKDMVRWKQLPHAILPYSHGAIWSGTAVVDHNNSLGKQTGDTKTIVAYFTKTQPKPKHFIQAAAYSTDRGRTFTLIRKGQAVVPNQGFSHGERDPKVFWDKATKKWVMVLILGGGRPATIRFFTSDNMVDWKKSGDIKRPWAAECIDLFRLPVDGDKANMKWVIADASFDYEVGEFDGKVFSSTEDTLQGDYGVRCFYAAQVFNNAPGGRVVQIGWLRDKRADNVFLANNMPFNQQMSFPADLTLRTTPAGVRLFRRPVKEIESLYTKTHSFKNLSVASANKALSGVSAELIDMSIEFVPGDNGIVKLNLRGLQVVCGEIRKYRTRKGSTEARSVVFGGYQAPVPVIDGKVKLRILVDRTSIELFANDGAATVSCYAAPAGDNRKILVSSAQPIKINSLVVNELKSSWK